MDLLRTNLTKENRSRHPVHKQAKKVTPIRRLGEEPKGYAVVYDDGVYKIDSLSFDGGVVYNISKNHKGVLFNRESVQEAKNDINRLKQRDSAGIVSPDLLDAARDAWKLECKVEDLLKSKDEMQGYDLDFEVRGLVSDLNKLGFKTEGSCAGHSGEDAHGFVTFTLLSLNDKQRNQILEIAKKHGLKDVTIKNSDYVDNPESDEPPLLASTMHFSPIGIGSG